MTDEARAIRNTSMLRQCHPWFRTALSMTLAHLQALGFRPRIQCAWRSQAEQAAAHASGHSELAWGFHNATTLDGQPDALAADVLDDDAPLNPTRSYLLALARNARANGLETGILWGLPLGIRHAFDEVIRQPGKDWPGKVGWDPTHVQVGGLSLHDAQAGVRPTPPAETVNA